MSNVLKSDRILICEEKKYFFNAHRNVVAYPSPSKHGEKGKNAEKGTDTVKEKSPEVDIKIDVEEIKRQAEEQAKQQARLIVEKAEMQARKIIEEAEHKAQGVFEAARNQGYEEGHKAGYEKGLTEGRNKGENEYKNSIEEANALKNEYKKMREALYKSCEQDMVRLAISIARKIIDARMEEDEKVYLSIAEKTLAEVKHQKGIQLRCSSQDYPTAVANKSFLISILDGADDINIVEDMFLSRGSCIVETEGGGVDGSVDTQMNKIKKTFESLLLESAKS